MSNNVRSYRILVFDFGSQYTQLIIRKIREIGVYCELWDWRATEAQIKDFAPSGIILSGGPRSVLDKDAPLAADYIYRAGVPVLGICYGMQLMAMQLGGEVTGGTQGEFGYAQVEVIEPCAMLANIEDNLTVQGVSLLDVWMSHGDYVAKVPEGFKVTAVTKNFPVIAMADSAKQFYGVQFHPEVEHTFQGRRILQQFVLNICQCQPAWNPPAIIDDTIASLKKQVGSQGVLLGLSGGLDSAVVAMLLHRAIGNQLTCVFVDNGLLRSNETQQMIDAFVNHFGLNIIHIKAEEHFLNKLTGITDPEQKRITIGKTFIEVFDQQADKCSNIHWLAQGTIYSDVIESASSAAGDTHVIKSHHNVGGLPKVMTLKLIEPLRELFKDEVRAMGLALGLPSNMLNRHPFPGPGLGIRILGKVTKAKADTLRQADKIFIEELHKAKFYYKVSQAFTVLLPVKSVGVMGDCRKYGWVIALRAIKTNIFMTATWAYLPYELLQIVSSRIVNEVYSISRVVYDISNKPPATIEWE